MFTKVSAYVAIPIVIALYVGKYFDNRYDTTPWVFLSLTFFAFLISLFSIWRYLIKYMKELEKEALDKLDKKEDK